MRLAGGIIIGAIGAFLAACEPAKTPVDKLSYEQLEKVVESCFANGKIATDNYCKEADVVYEPQRAARKEKARVKKALADPGVPFAGFSQK